MTVGVVGCGIARRGFRRLFPVSTSICRAECASSFRFHHVQRDPKLATTSQRPGPWGNQSRTGTWRSSWSVLATYPPSWSPHSSPSTTPAASAPLRSSCMNCAYYSSSISPRAVFSSTPRTTLSTWGSVLEVFTVRPIWLLLSWCLRFIRCSCVCWWTSKALVLGLVVCSIRSVCCIYPGVRCILLLAQRIDCLLTALLLFHSGAISNSSHSSPLATTKSTSVYASKLRVSRSLICLKVALFLYLNIPSYILTI